jgi:hypothetical protein
MRNAILTHGISPFGHHYAQVFAERGHEAGVFSLSAYEPAEGEPVRLVGLPSFNPQETRKRLIPYLNTLGRVRRAIRESQPDIPLATYLSSAGMITSLDGARHIVLSAQGSDVMSRVGSSL